MLTKIIQFGLLFLVSLRGKHTIEEVVTARVNDKYGQLLSKIAITLAMISSFQKRIVLAIMIRRNLEKIMNHQINPITPI